MDATLTPAPDLQNHQAPPKTCGMAVASMVCGILGFFTLGLTGVAAVILGFLGLSKIKQSGGALEGRGMAIAGLVTGGMTAVILGVAILASLLTPALFSMQGKADQVMCLNNLKCLSAAMREFEMDFGSFPNDVVAGREARFAKLTGADCLKQLEVAGIINNLDVLLYTGRQQGQWLYFPISGAAVPSAAPVMISPPLKDKIAVLRADSSVTLYPVASRESILRSATVAPVRIPSTKRKH